MVLVLAALVWLLLLATDLFLAGTVDTVEIVAGLVFASMGTALALGLRRVAHRRLALDWTPARALLGPLGSLLPETWSVGRQLVTTIIAGADGRRGAFVHQLFDPGPDDDAQAAGRRAIAVLGISLAPGGFVIRGERSETMILHALPPKAASRDRAWPA